MSAIASQIASLTIVYSIVYSDADQRKHQSSTSLAFVREFTRDRWIPRTNGQLHGKCFHLMTSSCDWLASWTRPAEGSCLMDGILCFLSLVPLWAFSIFDVCSVFQRLLYPPLQRSWKGGILVSPCPSVRLWTELCPLCIFNNTHRIHFIFAHLIKQLQKVCCV